MNYHWHYDSNIIYFSNDFLPYIGKSSLTIQFVENQFVDSYDPTIENSKNLAIHFFLREDIHQNFHFKAFTKPWKVRGQDFELKLVDTAGQDEYAIFPAQLSMDMHGYVLVYSITSVQSFELLQVLLEKIMDMTGKIKYLLYFTLVMILSLCLLVLFMFQYSSCDCWQ